MCHCLFQVISLRFPHDSIFATGTVIFLRFFNPVLGNPTEYISRACCLLQQNPYLTLCLLSGMSAVKVYFNIFGMEKLLFFTLDVTIFAFLCSYI